MQLICPICHKSSKPSNWIAVSTEHKTVRMPHRKCLNRVLDSAQASASPNQEHIDCGIGAKAPAMPHATRGSAIVAGLPTVVAGRNSGE